MVKQVAFAALCLLLLVNVADAQTSLGALRLGNGAASAGANAFAVASDYCGYIRDFDDPPATFGDTTATIGAAAGADLGPADNCNAQASENVVASALIIGPSYSTVYAPEASVAVGHEASAFAFGSGGSYTGATESYGAAVAWDDYLVNDGAATAPCMNGFIDIIVTTSAQGNAFTGSWANAIVGGLQVVSNPPNGYNINWNGNLVATIATPPAGDVNVIVQLIDCAYGQPVRVAAEARTDQFPYTVFAMNDGQALADISVAAWFEAQDFGQNPPAAPRVVLQHRDEEGDPHGDPIEVDLSGGGGGY